ncbi:hypothetical protein KUTeg_001801 [Tegillarca granosa]|uniref:Hyccin n=1 Tax=Tegillarca granosa TaxID=220873 RepID=A0ABQ9FSH6_TEGGR|nr:hypothetical protein KUTeg_001801 [Tegillarca granosa]
MLSHQSIMRQSVLSYILQCYNGDIANLLPSSHEMLCKSCSRIMTSGFVDLFDDSDEHPSAHFHLHDDDHRDGLERRKSQVGELPPRIAVSPAMMIEMLTGLYYIMYNTNSSLGLQAIMNIHKRASYELYADVLLVTNAIRNTLQNLSGQLGEVPMGISVSLTPATSGHMISKSAITNASFRTKKLPDDIQIIPSGDDSQTKLPTIEEDSDTPGKPVSKSSSIIGKLGKRLEKTKKDMKKDTEQNAVVSSITNGDTCRQCTSWCDEK